MARTARMKLTGEGTAYYHLMSRTNDKRFLFEKGRVKTEMVAALRRAAAFSTVPWCTCDSTGNSTLCSSCPRSC